MNFFQAQTKKEDSDTVTEEKVTDENGEEEDDPSNGSDSATDESDPQVVSSTFSDFSCFEYKLEVIHRWGYLGWM